MSTPEVLALDPAGITGWALAARKVPIEFGEWPLGHYPTKEKTPGTRYLDFYCRLEALAERAPDLALIVFEYGFQRGREATLYHAGYQAVIELFGARLDIPTAGVAVQTVKKHSGKGFASKDYVQRFSRGSSGRRTASTRRR